MAKRANAIPKAPMGRILETAGAKRVSQEAIDAFQVLITDKAEEIGKRAVSIAEHSGRKTVKSGDIKLAAKN